MRLSLCSLLFILLGTSAGIILNADVFVDLILNVRKFYSVASVIFVHPGDMCGEYGDLQITHLIHTSTRLLSRRYIMTTDVHFKKLWRTLKYYQQITRPITVVIIPNFEAYLEFVDAVKTYPMSFPVWFILFLYIPDISTHDYCRQPIGNPFNLTFDTQMLVLCNNETILREWYSVKGDIVKIFDLAEWRDDKRFVPLTNLSLYERRNDMEGVVLRAVASESLFSTIDGNQVATMYGKVLEELTSSLNFTVNIVSQITEHGIQNRQTLIWSGVMGKMVSGCADFAVADMSLTSLRKDYVDFTLPLIVSRINLYIKEPGMCGVKWIGYFQTFNSCTWVTIIILIATVPLLLFFMKSYRGQSRNAMDLISENFICIWGIFCQQALIEFPKNLSLRVAYFTIFLTAMSIMAHYSAALICFLTVCNRVLPFQTLEEFADDVAKLERKYEAVYARFVRWRDKKKINGLSETVFLTYLSELSETQAPTSLWAIYSSLRKIIQARYNINIHDYAQVLQFLKKMSIGYKVKNVKIFSPEQCQQFIKEAPDDEYLVIKVALILGIQGACRKQELCDLTVDNIFDKGDMIVVKIPKTKNRGTRSFIITEHFYQIYKKYAVLRPRDIDSKRFFLNFKNGKCSRNVIGINTIANFPKIIATYLKLDEPENYTSHTFRKTSATFLEDSDASILDIQRQEDWKSSTITANYVEDSVDNKEEVRKIIANEIYNAPTTSTAHVEMHNKKRTFTAIENKNTDLSTPSKTIRIDMSKYKNINLNLSNCNNLTFIFENNEQ